MKKSESPTGIEPMTSRSWGVRSVHRATRTHGEHGPSGMQDACNIWTQLGDSDIRRLRSYDGDAENNVD